MMIKLVKILAIVIVILAGAFVYRLWSLGAASQAMVPTVGLVGGSLRPCENNGHCISSESEEDAAYVAPISMAQSSSTDSMQKLAAAIASIGGVVKIQKEGYLHAEFTSDLFGFRDDVEAHIVDGQIRLRSESRVGKSDMGANRKRVEALRTALINDSSP